MRIIGGYNTKPFKVRPKREKTIQTNFILVRGRRFHQRSENTLVSRELENKLQSQITFSGDRTTTCRRKGP